MAQVFFTEEFARDGLNPYEAVLMASKESRRLNKIRLMNDLAEGEEKVTTLAMKRLVNKKIELSYGEGEAGDAASK
ncbi:MAG: hypothetical protein O7G87_00815 [bacterium]|nr:hypothetical protein [bacterium]